MIEATAEKFNFTNVEFEKFTKEELIFKFKELKEYTEELEQKEKKNLLELAKLKNIILMNYISSKEPELSVCLKPKFS